MNVLAQGNENWRMGIQEIFWTKNSGLSLTFVGSGMEQKLRLPACGLTAFSLYPSLSLIGTVRGLAHTVCGFPSPHICATFTPAFLNQPLVGHAGPRAAHVGSVAFLQEDHLGRGPHRYWQQAWGRHLDREFQDPSYQGEV